MRKRMEAMLDTKPGLTMYVVYRNPSDYPGKYVVREWSLSPGGVLCANMNPHAVADTIEDARESIPDDAARLLRHAEDDPVIEETWVL